MLSKAFLRKKRWTEHELDGLFAKERDGKQVILPIWHDITQNDLAAYSTSFVDRIAMFSDKHSITEIVEDENTFSAGHGRKLPKPRRRGNHGTLGTVPSVPEFLVQMAFDYGATLRWITFRGT